MAGMPTVSDVVELLDSLDVPNAQLFWAGVDDVPKPPYALLVPHGTQSVIADRTVVYEARRYDIELYSKERDVPLERRIAGALRQAGIAYSSDVAMDDKGQVVITYFSMTLTEQEADNV